MNNRINSPTRSDATDSNEAPATDTNPRQDYEAVCFCCGWMTQFVSAHSAEEAAKMALTRQRAYERYMGLIASKSRVECVARLVRKRRDIEPCDEPDWADYDERHWARVKAIILTVSAIAALMFTGKVLFLGWHRGF